MSRPKFPVYHLGRLGQFCSGSGTDVDFVLLPCLVVSRDADIRTDCKNADDLRAVLIAHWRASGRNFRVDDVLEWAMDRTPPMTVNEVTSGLRHVAVDSDWFRY